MMGGGLVGMAIEIVIVALLATTIFHCVRLNARLKRLMADEKVLVATIGELVNATGAAERAIAGLKLTVRESEETLARRLADAEAFDGRFAAALAQGERVLAQLSPLQGPTALAEATASLRQAPAQPAIAQPAVSWPAPPVIQPPSPAPVIDPASASATALAAQSFAERARIRLTRRAA